MDYILYEKKENVAWITINRPETLNALSTQTLKELLECLNKAQNDMDILCVVLTGAGDKAFSAGGDIKEERDLTSTQAIDFLKLGHSVSLKIQNLRIPVIAAINGYAIGGGMEISLSCDIVIASDNAKFGMPPVKLGIISGFGGTQLAARILGSARAKELMFTGRIFKADEALNLGIVQRVVEKDKLIEEVTALSMEIASMPPYAVRATKESINVGINLDIASAFSLEEKYAAPCYDTADKYEAMTAFLEKRKPNKFTDR